MTTCQIKMNNSSLFLKDLELLHSNSWFFVPIALIPLIFPLLGSKAGLKSTHNHILTGYKNMGTEKEERPSCFYEPLNRYQIFPNQKAPIHAAQEERENLSSKP